MRVCNRDGELVETSFDAIKQRIQKLCTPEELASVDIDIVVQHTSNGFKDGITTRELDELSASTCSQMQTYHYAYDRIAARIIVSNMEKTVRRLVPCAGSSPTFSEKVDFISKMNPVLLDPQFVAFVAEHASTLDGAIRRDRDYQNYTYFSIRTQQNSYLIKNEAGVHVESPQDMYMRVAVAINMSDAKLDVPARIRNIISCYEGMSTLKYTHATPTLFNAGLRAQQLCSCFLGGMKDELNDIYDALRRCACISKWAGGIGLHVSNVRASGAPIASTGGTSKGLVKMLKVYNEAARYCDQSGRRPGSFAIYLEMWHADVWDFVEMRLPVGSETERARDLFNALWVSDEFMHRLARDDDWYFMSPDKCPGLVDAVGVDFTALYARYIEEGRYVKKPIKARALWAHVMASQVETGTPYIMFKDHVNRKSNQSNRGTIRSSNLCVAPETVILTDAGFHPIAELEGKPVRVWNGRVFSDTVVHKTGTNAPLICVLFSNGETIDCTPYHKFYVREQGAADKDAVKVVEAKDLKYGSVIAPFDLPLVPDAGLLRNGGNSGNSGNSGSEREAPVNHVLEEKLRWLEALVDGTEGAGGGEGGGDLEVPSLDLDFLIGVKRMLGTMGVHSTVASVHFHAGALAKKRRSSGGYVLVVSASDDLAKLRALGFAPRRKAQAAAEAQAQATEAQAAEAQAAAGGFSSSTPPVVVSGVIDKGRLDDTYCFTEPLEGKGVFNGILAGNCSEICEYSDESEYAVCNLASISIPAFVDAASKTFDHAGLYAMVKEVTHNLDRIIDINMYPIPEAKLSNERMRPIGIGIQGMSDAYCMLRMPFHSKEAVELDAEVMETIYHASVAASVELAQRDGPYPYFAGSPASEGRLQMDLWRECGHLKREPSARYDWDELRKRVVRHGLRNSLLTALMPTASTSQIMGNTESFEPIQSNVFKRTTIVGEFLIMNKHLMRDLLALGLWSPEMRAKIIESNGSVQNIPEIPDHIKSLYRTVWELPLRSIVNHAIARAPYVDQSQSMNLYLAKPDPHALRNILHYGWSAGLKTGMYYLRSLPASEANKLGIFATAETTKKRTISAFLAPSGIAAASNAAPAPEAPNANANANAGENAPGDGGGGGGGGGSGASNANNACPYKKRGGGIPDAGDAEDGCLMCSS